MNQTISQNPANTQIVTVIYILLLLTLLTGGVTAIVGVVMAYIYRDGAPEWLRTHLEFQISTFWLGLVFAIVSFALAWVLIGFVLGFITVIWWVVRCVKGLRYLGERVPYPDYRGWGF